MAAPVNTEGCQVLQNKQVLDTSGFFNNEDLSDVTLVVGDKQFYAHRFILAKSSCVFRTMLYCSHWCESHGEEVHMVETPECQAVFHQFIKYLYTGEVAVNVQTALSILHLADKYDVALLKDLCLSYMVRQSPVVKIETAISWYTWAKVMDLTKLISGCAQTVMLNVKLVRESSMWVELAIDCLADILSSSELVIHQEYDLFLGLREWLLHDSHVSGLEENSKRLLPLIRFPQMQTKQLLLVEQSKLASLKECAEILHILIGRAYRFRALYPSHVMHEFSSIFYMPRYYLTLMVYSLNINEFNSTACFLKDLESDLELVHSDSKRGLWNVGFKRTDKSSCYLHFRVTDLCNKTVQIELSLLVVDRESRVIQTVKTPTHMCQKGSKINMALTLSHPDKAHALWLIMKPMLSVN